jgi:hypothetical protein
MPERECSTVTAPSTRDSSNPRSQSHQALKAEPMAAVQAALAE